MSNSNVTISEAGIPAQGAGDAVVGCTVIGPGSMKHFNIDGSVIFKKVTWKKEMRVRAGVGLICDGRKRVTIEENQYWGCHSMDVQHAIVLNEIDRALLTEQSTTD